LPEFEKILRDNHVAYIITSLRWENMMTYEFSMKESHRLWFEPLYSVANLRIMKVHSMLREPDISFADIVQAPDTLTASGLLRKGRTELLGGAYGPASVTFGRALQLAPFQPEVVYQNLVVHAFRGDTSGALDHFQRLLTLTQAGSFAYVARTQMQALQLLRDAQLARATDQHDVKILDAGTMYWDLGYRQHASEIINTLLHSGSNYFFGMLWGFHYARQQGDTATAHAYLQRLEQIDSSNAVVKIFETCFAVDDSIAATNAMPEKSRLHLSLARYYRQIELNEEAIDEAERAIGLDSSNTQALIFLGEMFIQKGKPRPAIVYYGDAYTLDAHNVRASAIVDSLRVVLAGN
jgi:tetratricopeptide (TPR) repeat protein